MTDQLMDNLTNEEHEALLLMSEHAIAPPLSPAAQAVLDAYFTHADLLNREVSNEEMIAAALRAAADQVVPTTVDPRLSTVRFRLMRIAAELEGQ
jgi:hypothetical protein